MRLFVAIDIPKSAKDQLQTLQVNLPDAKWVNSQLFHLTLSFIGETEQIDTIKNALAEVRASVFKMKLVGVGRFPIETEPKAQVLYVGVDSQSALTALHQQITQVLLDKGFEQETSPFLPHITLAYIDTHDFLPGIRNFMETNQAFQTDTFTVSEFILYSSNWVPEAEEIRYGNEAVFSLKPS